MKDVDQRSLRVSIPILAVADCTGQVRLFQPAVPAGILRTLPPRIEPALNSGAPGEEVPPFRTEFALEFGDEGDRRRRQHLLIAAPQHTAHDKVLR